MKNLSLVVLAAAVLATLAACGQQPAAEQEAATEVATEAATEAAAGTAEVVMTLPMTTSSDEAKNHFLEGLRTSDMGRFVEAQEHFQAAVDADPDFAFAYLGMATTSTSLEAFAGNLKLATEHAHGASEAERLFIESTQKGFENDLEGQLALTEKLIELQPDSPRAWLLLAQAQASLGRYGEERDTATKATGLSPDFAPAYAQLGNSYLFNEPRDFTKAEEYMRKVAELEPDEPQSHDFLGDVYRGQSKLAEARDAYTRAAELDPTNGSPLQQRGHVNSFLGNWEEARADYDAAIALSDPDTRASFAVWRALVSVYEGKPEAAVAELDELVAAVDEMDIPAPRSAKVNALINLSVIATHHGMFKPAETALDQCHTLMMEQAEEVGIEEFRRSQEATMAYFEGVLAAREGDYDTALAKAEEFMEILEPDANPRKNEPAHEVMGLTSLLQGDYQEALKHYQQTDPSNVYAKYHRALAYEGKGDTEKAQQLFREVADYNFNFVGFALIRQEAANKLH